MKQRKFGLSEITFCEISTDKKIAGTSNVGGGGEVYNLLQAKAGYFCAHLTFVV
jgi:hypothetical protein